MKKSILLVLVILFSNILISKSQNYGCTASLSESTESTLSLTTGNYALDAGIQREVDILRSAFGVNCQVWIMQDDPYSPNADASPDITNSYRPDGTVRLGYNMMQKQLSLSKWGATLPFILAHEFGHIKAFKNGWHFSEGDYTVKKDELFADFAAGLYMWDRQFLLTTDVMTTIYSFMQIGDMEFTNPNHHGTPEERRDALLAGYNYLRNFRMYYPGMQFTDDLFYNAYNEYMVNNIY